MHGGRVGGKSSPEYVSFRAMLARCYNDKCSSYIRYGARGIRVCERWRNSFDNFLQDMGRRPPGHTLDRIDPKGNYDPRNCRWADKKKQARNTSANRILDFEGRALPIGQWANLMRMSVETLHMRLKAGWPVDKALMTPVAKRR